MSEPFVALVNSPLSDALYIHHLFEETDVATAFKGLNFSSIEEVEHYLTRQHNGEITPSFFQSIRLTFHEGEVHDDSNSLFAGVIFLYHTKSKFMEDPFPCLGFAMLPAHRNLGLMHIALSNILNLMLEVNYLYTITCVHPKNAIGIALLEKTGFIRLEESDDELLYAKRLAMNEDDFNRDFQIGT